MGIDKFGSLDVGIINVDDINEDELKALWEQTEGLRRKLCDDTFCSASLFVAEHCDKHCYIRPEDRIGCIDVMDKKIVFVPKNQYDYFGREDVKAAADKLGVIVVPVDNSDPFERSMAHLIISKPDGALLFEKKDVPPLDVIVDTNDLPNERYHDRTFPMDYIKKKKAKRRIQKQSRRKK